MATLAERIASNQAAIDRIESGAQSTAVDGQSVTHALLEGLYRERERLQREFKWAEQPGGRRTIYES